MGISPGWLAFFLDVVRSEGIASGDGMLDLGASELFCADEPQRLNEVLAAFNAPLYTPGELARISNRGFAGELFRRAGLRYVAIDYADFPGVLRLDLNSDPLPAEHHGRYRFISNSGTSEHILNQHNVFKVMHDAGAPGSIFYHGVPGWGDYEHGILQYSPKFFWALAAANDYELLRFWGWSDGNAVPLNGQIMRRIEFASAPVSEKVWLHVLLRKRSDRPFAALNDPAFRPEWRSPINVLFRYQPKPVSMIRRAIRLVWRPVLRAGRTLARVVADQLEALLHHR
jgi:hypothetical protein